MNTNSDQKPAPNNSDDEEILAAFAEAEAANVNQPETSEQSEQSEQLHAPEVSKAPTDQSAKITELTNDLQRTRADFENFRKQTELQRSQAMNASRLATVEKFLPLVDDFSRAITTYPEQLAPLEKSLVKLLDSLNLKPMDTAPGTIFNPDFHEAISVEGEGDVEVITETLRPGYLYEDTVLRPAMVKVGYSAKA